MVSNNTVQNRQETAIFQARGVRVYYGGFMALREVDIELPEKKL